jgi:hypothetical protein
MIIDIASYIKSLQKNKQFYERPYLKQNGSKWDINPHLEPERQTKQIN